MSFKILNASLIEQISSLFAEMPMVLGLSLAIAISAILCIWGKYSHKNKVVYVFKPLATTLVLFIVLVGGNLSSLYSQLVAIALVFSLAGDVFLMLPKDRFIAGLASFLVAHVFLIVAFSLQPFGFNWWLLLTIVILATAMFLILSPKLNNLKLPVGAYILVIAVMVWLGCEIWLEKPTLSTQLVALGSILFLISDGLLALNRFKKSFKSADIFILSTYFTAIWCFSLSTLP